MGIKIIEVGIHDIFNVMENVCHGMLVSKGSPWTNEGNFLSIDGEYLNLVMARKSIHKGEYENPSAIIDILVDKGCGVIFLRTGFAKILRIEAYSNGNLFLHDRKNIGYPFHQGDGVNKTIIYNFLYFLFDHLLAHGQTQGSTLTTHQ